MWENISLQGFLLLVSRMINHDQSLPGPEPIKRWENKEYRIEYFMIMLTNGNYVAMSHEDGKVEYWLWQKRSYL